MDLKPTSQRLESWKDIARYLRRSVRTVRRWEADEGLPVHRQMHRTQGRVFAYPAELDAWLRAAERRSDAAHGTFTRDRSSAEDPAEVGSIVVLPFAYVGPGADEYLADGFTEEVIATLSSLPRLRVISRTSSMSLKGAGTDARTLAKSLDVGHLLEGAVRRQGDRVRVTVSLVDAHRDDRIWGETYEGELADAFGIQQQIARATVAALRLHLTPDEERRLGQRSFADIVEWRCLLQARQEALRWRRDAIDHAVELLHQALDVCGRSAALVSALGRTHLQYREAGIELGPGPLEAATECAQEVLARDPRSPQGLQLRGWVQYSRGDIQAAVHDLKAASVELPHDPDTLALLANCYLVSGRVPAARPLISRLLSIDPLTPLTRCLPGWADALEGRLAEAVGPYREMLALDPGNPMARLFLVWILTANARAGEAEEAAAGFPPTTRGSPAERVAAMFVAPGAGSAGAVAGPGAAAEQLAYATDLFPRFLAQAYALAGNTERALHWLSVAIERGFINFPFITRHDPQLSSLRYVPEAAPVLERARRRWEAFEA
jgi:TolB-like protein/tetratricopeptide (TPR) repeat protein